MKFILTLLMIAFLKTPIDQGLEDFNSQVQDGYSQYTVLYENTNTYYRLKIIEGVNDGKVNFGIYLFNIQSKSHRLVIEVGNSSYTLKTNSRGDYIVPAFSIEDEAKIFIIDEMNSIRYTLNIKNKSVSDFEKYEEIFDGNGQGLSKEKLRLTVNLETMDIITIVFIIVSCVFGVVLVLMYIFKLGMFNPNRRKANVYNFRPTIYVQEYEHDEETDHLEIDRTRFERVQEEEPQVVNMYPYQREYDDEDDDVDVGEILRNDGFNTDYSSLSEEEKNQIMLELMMLRDKKIISISSYKKEVIKLWKK